MHKSQKTLLTGVFALGGLHVAPFPCVFLMESSPALVLKVESTLTTVHIQSDHYLRRPLNIFDQNIQR